jgi:membrane protease YdiL (CAAX protease family)
MRSFPNPVIFEQVSAQQPSFQIVVLMYILPFWLLSFIFKTLLLLSPYAEFARDYPTCHQAIFFVCQVLLICGTVLMCSIKFPTALWKPRPTKCHALLVSAIALLAALYYLCRACWLMRFIGNATNSSNLQLEKIHESLWMALPYGDSLYGVYFSSVVLFFGPVFEEIIFSGFLVNLALKKYGIFTTVIVVPIIFTLAHIPQQGFGTHLFPIFCSGSAFVLIRLVSGNLLYSVLCHTIINCIFLFPGWIEAFIFFHT